MDHRKGLSTVFNCWNFCFTIITQWWAMVDFITQNGTIFHKIFKIFVVINQKLCDVCGQKLVLVVSTIGTTDTPSFVKIREVTQNSLLIWHGMTRIHVGYCTNTTGICTILETREWFRPRWSLCHSEIVQMSVFVQ